LKKGDHIFSINELSDEYLLSRDTVQKAYSLLRKKGVITAVKGKGFYINRTDITTPYRVLLIFNKISNYKKQIYNAFVQTMGDKAVVDLKIHHFSIQLFENLIADTINDYDYYVLMPHFYDDADEIYSILKKIPPDQLVILDKDLPYTYSKYAGVYQDFKNDIYNALESGLELLKKYNKIILVYPKIIPYPKEIITGFRSFCNGHNFPYEIINEIDSDTPVNKKEVYVVIEETDLVTLIKSCQTKGFKIGKDVGIISYNETPLKEILLDGITVISTDHHKMGETAARLILENRKEKIKNPFVLIQRKSL
jgi:DNA-binding LacI/PurR family transcriptional regulator